jgi:L-fucose dehydrogenase
MDLGFSGKVIIVTSGPDGSGEGIVRILSGEGAMVAMVGKNISGNRKLQKETESSGGEIFPLETELGDLADCERVVQTVIQKYGRIDGLVNSAGVNSRAGSGTIHSDNFLDSVQKSLGQYYLITHFAVPYLKISKGAIINISSKVPETGIDDNPAHAAVNGAVNALTREWAVELLKYDIRVNALIMKGHTAEIFNAVSFLLSEKSSHTTGQLIYMDAE